MMNKENTPDGQGRLPITGGRSRHTGIQSRIKYYQERGAEKNCYKRETKGRPPEVTIVGTSQAWTERVKKWGNRQGRCTDSKKGERGQGLNAEKGREA